MTGKKWPLLVVSLSLFLCSSAEFRVLAQGTIYPRTGTTSCYDSAGALLDPCPSEGEDHYGQDAQYAAIWPPMSYTCHVPVGGDLGGPVDCLPTAENKVVRDEVSGLIWQQLHVPGIPGLGTWDEAVERCDDLELGGFIDWRLPSIEEVISIVNYGRADPAIDVGAFGSAPLFSFWSGTTQAGFAGGAWVVSFGNGQLSGSFKTSPSSYVRCVRGPNWPAP